MTIETGNPLQAELSRISSRPVIDDLSVVIPTLGREIIQRALGALAAGTAWPAEIIIIDQGRNSRVAEWSAALTSGGLATRYCPSGQQGRASAVNRGIEQVATRFVAITDDDCLVDERWLENMAAQLRETPEAIITGRVEAAGDTETVALLSLPQPRVYRRPPLKFEPLCGGNMGVATAVIQQVGLFDEDPRIRAAEDCELSYRVLRSGIVIRYAPEILVFHIGWRDESGRVEQYRAYARSHGSFYGKYLRKGDWFIALRVLMHLSRAGKRWLRGILTARREQRLNGSAYVKGLIPGIIQGMRKDKTR